MEGAASVHAAAQRLVEELFQRLGEEPDGAVIDYCAGVLTEGEAGDLEVDEIRDHLLAGFSTAFAALEREEQNSIVFDLIAKVKAAEEQAAAAALPPPGTSGGLASALRALSLNAEEPRPQQQQQQQQQQPAAPDLGGAPPAAPAEAVALLRGLCGGSVGDAFLSHLLAKCGGDVEATAAYLLDADDLPGEQAAWERAEAQRREEAERAEEARRLDRQKILHKFQLEAVRDGDGRKPQQITAWASKEDASKSKTRFRDGRLVSTKGDKYIVEKIGEEWDGGSRGKVKTKGKRGPGWV